MVKSIQKGTWKSASGRVYEVNSCIACCKATISQTLCPDCFGDYLESRFARGADISPDARIGAMMRFATKRRIARVTGA